MESTCTHEIFCPEIIEAHTIASLSEAFEELKSVYQTDNENELQLSNKPEPSPIPESDSYSSDELDELPECEIKF